MKLAREKAPIFKQLKWYEGRQEHILDVVLDPLGEWLACACLSGDLYLVPILPLMTVCTKKNLNITHFSSLVLLELLPKTQVWCT